MSAEKSQDLLLLARDALATRTTHNTHQLYSNHLVPEYGQTGDLGFCTHKQHRWVHVCVRMCPYADALPESSSGIRYMQLFLNSTFRTMPHTPRAIGHL